MANTPNMLLALPTPSVTSGPGWATLLNAALTLVDSHNHTSGQGALVPTAGINVNADLPLNTFNLTQIRTSRYVSQTNALSLPTDSDCIYVSGGDLYYNNGSGTAIQITSGSAISASSLGGISGLSGTAGSASYSSSTGTFTFLSSATVKAIMDFGPLVIRSQTTGFGTTIQAAPALAASFSVTLPTALPASTLPLSLAASGQVSTGQITRQQIISVGQQVSASCGAFVTASTTPVAVTNLSVTIVTTGRPVVVALVPDGGTYALGNYASVDVPAGKNGQVIYNRDATIAWQHRYGTVSTATLSFPPPPAIIDAVSAGSHTYTVSMVAGGGAGNLGLNRCVLLAYEL